MNAIVVWIGTGPAIGRDNGLLFSPPAGDMKRFRTLTAGGTPDYGRKTLDSFPGGRLLPKRRNIVITRDPAFQREGCEVVHSPAEALTWQAAAATSGSSAGQYLCRPAGSVQPGIHHRVNAAAPDADTFFPDLDSLPEWSETYTEAPVTENGLTYRFVEYVREEA